MNKKNITLIGGASATFAFVLLLFSVSFYENTPDEVTILDLDKEIFIETTDDDIFASTQEIKKITSEAQLKEFLAEAYKLDTDPRVFDTSVRVITDSGGWNSAEEAMMAVPEPVPSHGGIESLQLEQRTSTGSISLDRTIYGEDYSATNIQVQNVDEPDFLKNDGKYVYILSDDKLTIIDGYPAEDAKIILKIGLDVERQDLQNMFLNDNRV